jgi:hypothetical protein
MAKNFGKVNVSITASTGGLTAGLAKATQRLGAFGATVSKMTGLSSVNSVFGGMARSVASTLNPIRLLTRAFGSLLGQAVLLAGIAAPFMALGRAASSLDAISKSAKRLGMSTTELQNLTQVAEEAGVGGEQLVGILTRMQRSTVALAQGSRTATAAFATLGLTTKDLAGLSAQDQFALISRHIMALPTEAERASAAFAIFGRQGAVAMGFIEASAGGAIAEMAALRDALGVNLTNDQSAEIERMNDMLGRVGMVASGFFNQLLAGIAPTIADVADRMTKFFASNESGFSLAGAAAETFNSILLAIEPVFMSLYKFIQQIAPVAQVAFDLIGQAFTVVKDLFMAGVTQLNSIFEGFFGETAGGFESTNVLAMAFANGLRLIAGTVTFLYGAFQVLFSIFAKLEQGFSNLLSLISGGLAGVLNRFADAAERAGLTSLAESLRSGAETSQNFSDAAGREAQGWGEAAAAAFANGMDNMSNPFAGFDASTTQTLAGAETATQKKATKDAGGSIAEAVKVSSADLKAIVVGSSEGQAFRNSIMRGADPRLDVKKEQERTADATERTADTLDELAGNFTGFGLATLNA